MGKQCNVALVGATGVVGEAVLAILADRHFPADKVYALADEQGAGATVSFGNRELVVQDLAAFDFRQAQLALFAAPSDGYCQRAVAAGCLVIDGSGRSSAAADVPLVVPEVNLPALAACRGRGIVASPACSAILLAMALKPIHEAAGIERINVATFDPVSGSGREATEELGRQTADLLSFRSVEPRVYPRQIAFNAIPHVGAFQDNGYTAEEMATVQQTRRLLGDDSIQVNPTAVRVPVFYGHSACLHVETRRRLGAAQARVLLAQAPGVEVLDELQDGGYPTPVSEASGSDAVYVGRIREDLAHPRGLNLWAVTDNLRKGSALNMVQIAEALVRDYL